jgi:hypothetical protein
MWSTTQSVRRLAVGVLGAGVLAGAVLVGPMPLAEAAGPLGGASLVEPPDPSPPVLPDLPEMDVPGDHSPTIQGPPVHHHRSHHRPPTST